MAARKKGLPRARHILKSPGKRVSLSRVHKDRAWKLKRLQGLELPGVRSTWKPERRYAYFLLLRKLWHARFPRALPLTPGHWTLLQHLRAEFLDWFSVKGTRYACLSAAGQRHPAMQAIAERGGKNVEGAGLADLPENARRVERPPLPVRSHRVPRWAKGDWALRNPVKVALSKQGLLRLRAMAGICTQRFRGALNALLLRGSVQLPVSEISQAENNAFLVSAQASDLLKTESGKREWVLRLGPGGREPLRRLLVARSGKGRPSLK